MADQAKIKDVEALESFRSSLIIFQSKAKLALEEVQQDIKRTRLWLQNDVRVHWESQLKRRLRILDQANAELDSARFSALVDNPTLQQMQVRKAKRLVEEAEEKIRIIKKWTRDFDHLADPLHRRLDGLTYYLDNDIPRGTAFLHQAVQTLEAYQQVGRDLASS
jgi:hypothetical protein